MPASSLFAEMERPVSTPNAMNNTSPMDDQRALQLALELSLLGISNDGVPTSDQDYVVAGLSEAERTRRSQNMTECVAVPSSEHVAEIVGRQGCKIKALRAKTNTYIKTPVRGEEPVFVVTGRKEDVAMAKREILSAAEHFSQIRACRKNNLNGSMAPGPPTNIPGQVTIQVRVPYRVVGLVVGPKGATIKRIQQQTHTYIVTPSRDKEPVFEVTGLPESVDQARKEIEAHIALRTGSLLDQDEAAGASMAAAAAAAAAVTANGRLADFSGAVHNMNGTHSLENLFSSTDLVSSLYKLSNGTTSQNGFNSLGLNGTTTTSTLNNLNNLNGLNNGTSLGGTLNSLNNQLGDINYLLGDSNNSLLGKSGLENGLFGGLVNNTSSSKFGTSDLNGVGPIGSSLYNVDEGLGSLGSSMGSSPSFDPTPSGIWSDLGRAIGSTLATSGTAGSLGSTFSSLSSSLTRRSSSLSGTSPPSRLSPTPETHPPARRISSDSAVVGGPIGPPASSASASPSSTPELGALTGPAQRCSPSLEKLCRSCGENGVVAALVPCGHNLFCMECARRCVNETGKCNICNEDVTQAIRIFS